MYDTSEVMPQNLQKILYASYALKTEGDTKEIQEVGQNGVDYVFSKMKALGFIFDSLHGKWVPLNRRARHEN